MWSRSSPSPSCRSAPARCRRSCRRRGFGPTLSRRSPARKRASPARRWRWSSRTTSIAPPTAPRWSTFATRPCPRRPRSTPHSRPQRRGSSTSGPTTPPARPTGAVGDVARGFSEAHVIVEAVIGVPRIAAMPIEPRGVLVQPEAPDGRLTIWTSTQVPFAVRAAIAAALGLAEEQVRVIAPDVGGGFGAKGHVYPEDVLLAAVARRLGRPVKWIETRREHFLATAPDRDQRHRARLGVTRDGAITAIETAFTRDGGAYPVHRRRDLAEHDQSPAGTLPDRASQGLGRQRGDPQDVRRRLSRRRTARERPGARPASRPRGAAGRSGSRGAAAPQSHPPGRDALHDRASIPRRRPDRLRSRRFPDRVRSACSRASATTSGAPSSRRDGPRLGRSASACRRTSRARESDRSRAPTSRSTRAAWSISRSASPPRARRTRPPWRRCARPSSASTRSASSSWAATPPSSVTATARSRAASPRWRGRPWRGPRARSRERRGWSPASCSSARPRTSCSPRAGRTWPA